MTETHTPPAPARAPNRPDTMILVPFVDGMLRDQTTAAISDTAFPHLLQPIDATDPGDYARAFRDWWDLPMDIVVIEQDMAPTPAQITRLILHPDEWVSAPYHVGSGRYTTGLGFCKIAASLRERRPDAGFNITADPRDPRGYVSWLGLNESVERHLGRLGERMTVIEDPVIHLHHPLGGSDG